MQPLPGNQRPDLLTSCLLYCGCHGKCIFADPLQMSQACHRFWKCYKTLTFCSLLTRCTIPCTCHAKPRLNLQKWSEHVVFLYILTWKRASRHSVIHFLNISTSKSAPRLTCFAHFDLEMCLAPQRRALFRHLNFKSAPKVSFFHTFDFQMCFAPLRCALFRHHNFQKRSDVGVFCAFWLGNVVRAAMACNFSSLIWPHGSAPAALASLVFRPSRATNLWKNAVFYDFPTFSRTCIFFLLTLSLLWSSLFYSSLLWLFPPLLFICPYCRKFDF